MTERERAEEAARAYMDEDPVPQCADEDDFVDRMTGFALAQRQEAASERDSAMSLLDQAERELRCCIREWGLPAVTDAIARHEATIDDEPTPTEPPDRCPHGNPGNYPDCCSAEALREKKGTG